MGVYLLDDLPLGVIGKAIGAIGLDDFVARYKKGRAAAKAAKQS